MSRRWLLVAAVAAAGCLIAGWLAARAFESPAQRQARARPPAPRPIVAVVTVGALDDEITARADVEPAVADRIAPRALPERPVVTAQPLRPGSEVRAGDSLLAIDGRPLFVLPGRFGFYRDIADGMSGPDVAQLQAGLVTAGLLAAGDAGGTYGPATQTAVRALYARVGAEPVTQAAAAPTAPPARGKSRPAAPPQLPIVPLTEVVVAPRLPARLARSLAVGAEPHADRPVATLTSGMLVAHAGVAAGVVGQIRRGMRAQLIGPSGRAVDAEVLAVHGTRKSAAGELRDVQLRAVHGGTLPPAWRGRNVLARIVTTRVSARALIVPTRAVARADGERAFVLKRVDDGAFVRVPVRVLGSLAGRSAVVPIAPQGLVASDRVRVG